MSDRHRHIGFNTKMTPNYCNIIIIIILKTLSASPLVIESIFGEKEMMCIGTEIQFQQI